MRKKKGKYEEKLSDELIDSLAELLVDDFLAKKAVDKLPKPLKRGRQSVRK